MVKKSHVFFKEGANFKEKNSQMFFFKGTLMKRTVLKRKEQKEFEKKRTKRTRASSSTFLSSSTFVTF
jgi:hypothetical protein